mgnify:CR=1 FL=1
MIRCSNADAEADAELGRPMLCLLPEKCEAAGLPREDGFHHTGCRCNPCLGVGPRRNLHGDY